MKHNLMLSAAAAALLLSGISTNASALDLTGGERVILAQDAGGGAGGGAGGTPGNARDGLPAPNRSGIAGAAGGAGGGGTSGTPDITTGVSNEPLSAGGGPAVIVPPADVTTGGPLVAPAPRSQSDVIVVPAPH